MFKAGESGNPAGRPKGSKNKSTRKADEAFDLAFDELQADPSANLAAWARANPGDFYRLYAKKITTHADNLNHTVTENLSEEHARLVAETYLDSLRGIPGDGAKEPAGVHGGDEAGLSGGGVTSPDR